MKKHGTFSRRLVLAYTCIVAIPLFVIVACTVHVVRKRQFLNLAAACRAVSEEHREHINKNIDSFSLLERMINGNGSLMLFFSIPERSNESEIIETMIAEGTTIERTLSVMPEIYGLRVFADNPLILERWPIFLNSSRTDLAVLKDWEFNYIAEYLGNLDQLKFESVCSTRRIIKNRQPIGYIQITMKMSDFFPFLYKNADTTEHDYIFEERIDTSDGTKSLVPITNETVSALHGTLDEKDTDALTALLNNSKSSSGQMTLTANGDTRFASYFRSEELGIVAVHTSSVKVIQQNVMLIELIAVACLLLTIAAVYFVVRFTTARLMSGVYSIMSGMEQVKRGDLNVTIPVNDTDEVGDAQETFNAMTTQLREQIEQITQEKQLIADTEMKAMQNQINAHFLYNALETIKMQAVISNQEDIAQSLAVLGKLLRYGLRWRVHIVTVAQELEYIRAYVYLLNIRNDYVILLKTEIPEAFQNIEIPKMTLQPLVENAFTHGIEHSGKDSVIRVYAHADADDPERLWLCVQDFGCGIMPEELKQITAYLDDDTYERDSKGNIGLKNIQQRLTVLCGKEYRIRISSTPGAGTLICVPVPLTPDYTRKKNP